MDNDIKSSWLSKHRVQHEKGHLKVEGIKTL